MLQNAQPSTESLAGKYLTFNLAEDEFGVRVLKVREIMGMQEITAVPQSPAYLMGVINLRGKVIPVVDLRLKFGGPAAEYTRRTCIIVMQIETGTESAMIGLLVDSVSEVINLSDDQIQKANEIAGTVAEYVLAIAKAKGKTVVLLDANKVISTKDLGFVHAAFTL